MQPLPYVPERARSVWPDAVTSREQALDGGALPGSGLEPAADGGSGWRWLNHPFSWLALHGAHTPRCRSHGPKSSRPETSHPTGLSCLGLGAQTTRPWSDSAPGQHALPPGRWDPEKVMPLDSQEGGGEAHVTTTCPKMQRKKRERSRGQMQLGLLPQQGQGRCSSAPGTQYTPPSFPEPICHLTAASGHVCTHMN